MIQANELRINDYVNISGINQKMRQCHFNEYINEQGFFVYINPIPLTEEWLLKFGANKYEFEHKWIKYRIDTMKFVIRKNTIFDYGTKVKLQFVHELQNLYFALTGEELEIKL